jgi:hypothetical protein
VTAGQKKTRDVTTDVRVRAAIPRFGPVHGATPSGPHGIRLKVSDAGAPSTTTLAATLAGRGGFGK